MEQRQGRRKGETTKARGEACGTSVHYLDYRVGFIGVYVYVEIHQTVHFKYAQFIVSQLYLEKAVKNP